MDQAIENGIGQRGITDGLMPMLDWKRVQSRHSQNLGYAEIGIL